MNDVILLSLVHENTHIFCILKSKKHAGILTIVHIFNSVRLALLSCPGVRLDCTTNVKTKRKVIVTKLTQKNK